MGTKIGRSAKQVDTTFKDVINASLATENRWERNQERSQYGPFVQRSFQPRETQSSRVQRGVKPGITNDRIVDQEFFSSTPAIFFLSIQPTQSYLIRSGSKGLPAIHQATGWTRIIFWLTVAPTASRTISGPMDLKKVYPALCRRVGEGHHPNPKIPSHFVLVSCVQCCRSFPLLLSSFQKVFENRPFSGRLCNVVSTSGNRATQHHPSKLRSVYSLPTAGFTPIE